MKLRDVRIDRPPKDEEAERRALERFERFQDALRFRRMVTREFLSLAEVSARSLSLWFHKGDPTEAPTRGVRRCTTEGIASTLGVHASYLTLGGPWLWALRPDELAYVLCESEEEPPLC